MVGGAAALTDTLVRGIVELQALKVSDDGARRLRVALIRHFTAWRDQPQVYLSSLREFRNDVDVLRFDDEYDRQGGDLSDEIRESFTDLCTTLGDVQPEDLSYQDRIAQMCRD